MTSLPLPPAKRGRVRTVEETRAARGEDPIRAACVRLFALHLIDQSTGVQYALVPPRSLDRRPSAESTPTRA